MFYPDIVFAALHICPARGTGDRVVCAVSRESINPGVEAVLYTIKKKRKKTIAALIKNFHFLFGHF